MHVDYHFPRFLSAVSLTILLAACAAPQHQTAKPLYEQEISLRTIDTAPYTPGYGNITIDRTVSGRLRVNIPETGVAFYLDEDISYAQLATPKKEGQSLLLPIRITKLNCHNLMVAYIFSGTKMQSFYYFEDDCLEPIIITDKARWTAQQNTVNSKISQWVFDGNKLQKTIINKMPPPKKQHSVIKNPTKKPKEKNRKNEKIHINLMD